MQLTLNVTNSATFIQIVCCEIWSVRPWTLLGDFPQSSSPNSAYIVYAGPGLAVGAKLRVFQQEKNAAEIYS